jgi:hypothetical protein
METDSISRQPLWLIFALLLALLLGAVWAGWVLGQKDKKDTDESELSQVRGLQGAMLGLLALLLGFTFSMAVQRFDARRELIVNEANSIGTAYLRADLVDEPERSALRQLLARYVDVRVEFYQAGIDEAKQDAINAQSDRLHEELWRNTLAAAAKRPVPPTALLVASMNEVIDTHGLRLASLRNHVPALIFWLLFAVAALTSGLTGYAAGFGRRPGWLPTLTVLLIISLVIIVILDIDRPRRGLIQTGQSSMLDLQKMIRASHSSAP